MTAAIARVHPIHWTRCQAATDPQTKPTDGLSPPVYVHHRHLLLLLSPNADTRFTVPRMVSHVLRGNSKLELLDTTVFVHVESLKYIF